MKKFKKLLLSIKEEISNDKITPTLAAEKLLKLFKS